MPQETVPPQPEPLVNVKLVLTTENVRSFQGIYDAIMAEEVARYRAAQVTQVEAASPELERAHATMLTVQKVAHYARGLGFSAMNIQAPASIACKPGTTEVNQDYFKTADFLQRVQKLQAGIESYLTAEKITKLPYVPLTLDLGQNTLDAYEAYLSRIEKGTREVQGSSAFNKQRQNVAKTTQDLFPFVLHNEGARVPVNPALVQFLNAKVEVVPPAPALIVPDSAYGLSRKIKRVRRIVHALKSARAMGIKTLEFSIPADIAREQGQNYFFSDDFLKRTQKVTGIFTPKNRIKEEHRVIRANLPLLIQHIAAQEKITQTAVDADTGGTASGGAGGTGGQGGTAGNSSVVSPVTPTSAMQQNFTTIPQTDKGANLMSDGMDGGDMGGQSPSEGGEREVGMFDGVADAALLMGTSGGDAPSAPQTEEAAPPAEEESVGPAGEEPSETRKETTLASDPTKRIDAKMFGFIVADFYAHNVFLLDEKGTSNSDKCWVPENYDFQRSFERGQIPSGILRLRYTRDSYKTLDVDMANQAITAKGGLNAEIAQHMVKIGARAWGSIRLTNPGTDAKDKEALYIACQAAKIREMADLAAKGKLPLDCAEMQALLEGKPETLTVPFYEANGELYKPSPRVIALGKLAQAEARAKLDKHLPGAPSASNPVGITGPAALPMREPHTDQPLPKALPKGKPGKAAQIAEELKITPPPEKPVQQTTATDLIAGVKEASPAAEETPKGLWGRVSAPVRRALGRDKKPYEIGHG